MALGFATREMAALVSAAAAIVAAAGACTTDYQQGKSDPLYGDYNALAGQAPPSPTIDLADGGGSSSGGTGGKPKCGTPVDGGTCAVSFANDILKGLVDVGKCTDAGCHVGAVPVAQPRIDPADAPGMWQEFQAFTISTGKPLINPCSTDDKQSALACNLYAAGSPGACGVHMPSGSAQLPPDLVTKVETWLKCGSPNN